jgi:hypothetical protein
MNAIILGLPIAAPPTAAMKSKPRCEAGDYISFDITNFTRFRNSGSGWTSRTKPPQNSPKPEETQGEQRWNVR